MNDELRRREQVRAYDDLHRSLQDILYEEDPAGLGVSVGAPADEYSPVVSRLIVLLRGQESEEEVRRVLLSMFKEATPSLTRRVWEVWRQFAERAL